MIAVLLALATVDLAVVDRATGKPLPCRIHLRDAAGAPVKAPGLPFWKDHFVCTGTVSLDLAPGRYAYEVERGPEWSKASGTFDAADGRVRIPLEHLADLPAKGWWPGDLHIHREPGETALHAAAEDLHILPVITWWNRKIVDTGAAAAAPLLRLDGGRLGRVMEGEDEREGGALLYFNLAKPLELRGLGPEAPSPMVFLREARTHPGVHVDIEKPFWWDVPVWLASGLVDTVGLANNHQCRSRMYETEAWGKPRDAKRLPPPLGNGWWSQELYVRILEAGVRLPPSAGSASGVLPNPVGYNRVYVKLEGGLDWDRWWEGLRAGRSFVTNGPLLLATADGKPPGHVFDAPGRIEVRAELLGRERVKALELVRNGRVERTFSPDESVAIECKESGWFLVRAVADEPATFRFAATAPWHVEIGGRRRISRAAAQFFKDWTTERMARVKVDDPAELRKVLEPHEAALRFWTDRAAQANAD